MLDHLTGYRSATSMTKCITRFLNLGSHYLATYNFMTVDSRTYAVRGTTLTRHLFVVVLPEVRACGTIEAAQIAMNNTTINFIMFMSYTYVMC